MPFGPTTAIPRPELLGHVREYVSGMRGLIAPWILPFMTVKEQLGNYYKIGAEAMHDLPDDSAASGGSLRTKDWGLTTDSYRCLKKGFKADITDEDKSRYATALDVEAFRLEECVRIVMGNFERTVAAACTNETTFPVSGTTGVTLGTPWDNASGTPAKDVQVGARQIMLKTGATPDQMRLILPAEAAHGGVPFVTDYFNRMKLDIEALTPEAKERELARYLGIGSVKIASGMYNSANSGATPTLAEMWDPEYAFLFVPTRVGNNPLLNVGGLGCTFVWDVWDEYQQGQMLSEAADALSIADVPLRITSERNAHDTDAGSVAVRWWRDPKIQSSKYGYLFKNVTT